MELSGVIFPTDPLNYILDMLPGDKYGVNVDTYSSTMERTRIR
jgi:hypothetical protein